MFRWIVGIVESLGYAGVALLTLLENVFPPIPSELILPLAGFLTERGTLTLWGAVVAGAVGSFTGAIGWYLVGRQLGEERVRRWIERHGRWILLDVEDVDGTQRWFERHGRTAVLLGRLVPGVRTLISLPAGFARMSLVQFALYSALGTVAWTVALVYAGRALGAQYERAANVVEYATWAVVGIGLALLVRRAVRRRNDGKRDRSR